MVNLRGRKLWGAADANSQRQVAHIFGGRPQQCDIPATVGIDSASPNHHHGWHLGGEFAMKNAGIVGDTASMREGRNTQS
jgi:hypothetical protein